MVSKNINVYYMYFRSVTFACVVLGLYGCSDNSQNQEIEKLQSEDGTLKLILEDLSWLAEDHSSFEICVVVKNKSTYTEVLSGFDDFGIKPIIRLDGIITESADNEMINYAFPLSANKLSPSESHRLCVVGKFDGEILEILNNRYFIPEQTKSVEIVFTYSASIQQTSITDGINEINQEVWSGEVLSNSVAMPLNVK